MRSGSCPQRHTPPPELSFSVRRAIFTSLPVVVALFLLPAIAFASPPDPSWIAGIYDGADGDDIVILVYETAVAHAAERSHVAPLPRLADLSLESIAHGIPGGRFARRPRAPPVRCSATVPHVVSSLPHCTSTALHIEVPVTRASTTKSCRSHGDESHFLLSFWLKDGEAEMPDRG
jgi:hypothetical protein